MLLRSIAPIDSLIHLRLTPITTFRHFMSTSASITHRPLLSPIHRYPSSSIITLCLTPITTFRHLVSTSVTLCFHHPSCAPISYQPLPIVIDHHLLPDTNHHSLVTHLNTIILYSPITTLRHHSVFTNHQSPLLTSSPASTPSAFYRFRFRLPRFYA